MATASLHRLSLCVFLSYLFASPGTGSTLATPNCSSSISSYDSMQTDLATKPGNAPQPIGYRNVAYYVVSSIIPATSPSHRSLIDRQNWAIYARDHQPQDIPADKLTHLLYAFANVHPETGEVSLTDTWADTDIRYPTDSGNDVGTNLFGCLKQIYLQKKRNRNLKVLLSIGGWSNRSTFAAPASTPDGRHKFATSAVALLKDLPFDGLDVDWEYPKTPQQGCDLAELLAATRIELDKYAASLPSRPHFLLTIASPAGPQNFPNFPFQKIDSHLDFWNMMAYDYAGSGDSVAGHQANVFLSNSTPQATPFSTDDAVTHYIHQGVPANKIVVGMPLYGRAFQNTTGPGAPFKGIGNGSFPEEEGIWQYKALPKPGAQAFQDNEAVASWSYDSASRTMISYDTPQVISQKIEYIKGTGLGGAMWWETSGDHPTSSKDSLITIAAEGLGEHGGQHMENSENFLDYPQSKYDNLRQGMPGE